MHSEQMGRTDLMWHCEDKHRGGTALHTSAKAKGKKKPEDKRSGKE
jgi:hypothetical protein